MRKTGILHAELSAALARLGHTDVVVISDAGLPRPPGVPVIDLAVRFGLPSFSDILAVISDEIVVEEATIATEMIEGNPDALELVTAHFGTPMKVPHEEFKSVSETASLIIRTGEAQPYANVALRCGVPF